MFHFILIATQLVGRRIFLEQPLVIYLHSALGLFGLFSLAPEVTEYDLDKCFTNVLPAAVSIGPETGVLIIYIPLRDTN